MIIVFNNRPITVAGRFAKIKVALRLVPALCVLLSMCSSLNAQISSNAMASANYKHPFETENTRKMSKRDGLLVIGKSAKNALPVSRGSTWRYRPVAAQLVIAVNSKSKMEMNPLTTKSNYKVQH